VRRRWYPVPPVTPFTVLGALGALSAAVAIVSGVAAWRRVRRVRRELSRRMQARWSDAGTPRFVARQQGHAVKAGTPDTRANAVGG
jgi:hypothetical protein